MPEIKNQFTGGKMNKDLDERLVPKGEYRDAMNIQVSTSEGSDVGTIQNVLGNTPGCVYVDPANAPNPIPALSTTVGSVSDEKNDSLYWLVAGPTDIIPFLPLGQNQTASLKDMIMRTNSLTPSGCEPVFVDKHSWCVGIDATMSDTDAIVFSDNALLSNVIAGMNVTVYSGGVPSSGPALVNSVGVLNAFEPVLWQSDQTAVSIVNPDIVYANKEIRVRTFNDYGCCGPCNIHDYSSVHPCTNFSNAGGQVSLPPGVGPWVPGGEHHQLYIAASDWVGGNLAPTIGSTITNVLNATGLNASIGTNILNGVPSATITNIQLDTICDNLQPGNQSGCFQAYILTIDQNIINFGVSGSGLDLLDPTYQGEANSYYGFNAIIEPAPFLQYSNTNGIYITPVSDHWLDDIYNVFYDANNVLIPGAFLQIDNYYGAGNIWPPFSCIDPATVSTPNDNFFSIIECPNSPNSPGAPVTPLGNNPHHHPLRFQTLNQYGAEAIYLNESIDYSTGDTLCFTGERVLEFEQENLITGINIVDDMLFWTDNFTEPKKINIPRSIQGTNHTDSLGDTHTGIVNHSTGIFPPGIYEPITKEHITVIRQSPKSALEMDLVSSRVDTSTYTARISISDINNPDLSSLWDQRSGSMPSLPFDFTSLTTDEGSNIFRVVIPADIDGNTNFILDTWSVGAKVVLKEFDSPGIPPSLPINDYTIKGTIVGWDYLGNDANEFDSSVGTWGAKVMIQADSISRAPLGPALGDDTIEYAIDLFEEDEKLFEFKLPRFSYRYKYEDGEYSTFAPWTSVAFMPGSFDYHPKKGYNLGMTNTLSHLFLRGFTSDIPLDVVEIDILYKEEISPNVYVVETIKPDAEAVYEINPNVLVNNWWANEFKIDKENIKAALPGNQILRPWDNVPKKALAQEVTGSRIIYGNYEQNYNLNVGNDIFNPLFKHSLYGGDEKIKSIKSLREYQLGVVFTDKYGRETPVLSNSSASFKVEKQNAINRNRLQVGLSNNGIPSNMEYFKFYIKETSGEYYNMAMDRYWDAEDGNVWVSFASTDRNKVDIDSFLILKKGVDSDELVTEPAKFKVVAIENEAPDFIKLNKTIISDVVHNSVNNPVFLTGSNEIPESNNSDFALNYHDGTLAIYSNSGIRNIHKTKEVGEEYYFQLFNLNGTKSSKRYRISKIETDIEVAVPLAATKFLIRLDEPFGTDINQFTNDINGLLVTHILDGTRAVFWSYKEESSAEFDGRFFVKIFNDDTFNKYVALPGGGTITNYGNKYGQKVYSFDSSKHSEAWNLLPLAGNILTGSANKAVSSSNQGNDPNWADYVNITNQAGALENANSGSNWKAHAAFFRGINVHKAQGAGPNTPDWGNHGRSQVKGFDAMDLHGSSVSSWEFEDVWFIDGSTSEGEYGGDWGATFNPSDTNHVPKGLSIGGANFIELGFGGIQPNQNGDAWPWQVTNGGAQSTDPDFYNLLTNTNYGTQGQLVQHLGTSTIFRWVDDPTGQVFKTSSFQDYNLVRHETKPSDSFGSNQHVAAAKGNASQLPLLNNIRYATSTFFRPGNFSKNFRLKFDDYENPGTPVKWDPYTPGQITSGLILQVQATTTMTVVQNTVDVSTTIGTDVTGLGGPGYGDQAIRVGMVWDDGGGGAVISKIVGNTLHFKHYDPTTPTSDWASQLNPGNFNVYQYGMNGISKNSAKNINFFNFGKGFSDAAFGVDAVGYEIQILQPSEVEALFPRFPAVFETEPKENEDLDIYYEITDNIPTNLNINTIASILPINAIVDISATDGSVGVNGYMAEAGTIIAHLPSGNEVVTSSDLSSFNIVLGDKLIVTKPNGNRISLEILATSTTTTSPIRSIFELKQNLINQTILSSWHNCYSFGNGVESNRIRDNYNLTYISNGVKASTTLSENYKQERRKYSLIYSGIYNSTSGVNSLNQFVAAEKITKEINPTYGSIQKLKAGWGGGGDLIALCEDRILKILANKDALFNADGNSNVTATDKVLGTATPYSGEYGISKNPESFASESYRAYFTDKVRGSVMRLSRDGLTAISDAGMKDWFRDNLKLNSRLVGSYDDKKDEYNLSLPITDDGGNRSVTYKENVKGWVSFKSFVTLNGISCANEYYTFKDANLWKHNHDVPGNRNTFYSVFTNTTFNVILNDAPGSVKSFYTLNYEGSDSKVTQFTSTTVDDYGNTIPATTDNQYYNLASSPGWYVDNVFTNKESGDIYEFIEKEGKWFNYLRGKDIPYTVGSNVILNPDGDSLFDQGSFAIQGLGALGGIGSPLAVYGCTNVLAINFSNIANIDDGSCIFPSPVGGCMLGTASNYDSTATFDTGNCTWYGCTDPQAFNFTTFPPEAQSYVANPGYGILDDGSCGGYVFGCTDFNAQNYDATATVDDGTCIPHVPGCLGIEDANNNLLVAATLASNYNSAATIDDGSCMWTYCNNVLDANGDAGYYVGYVNDIITQWTGYTFTSGYVINNDCISGGCTDTLAPNYDPLALYDDGSCLAAIIGCMDPTACNYDPTATSDDGSCILPDGCTDPGASNYDSTAICDDGSCIGCLYGCTDPLACNYDANATCDDGSCQSVLGCTDSTACNYNANATCDDGTCVLPDGCTDPTACNYDSTATCNDGSCILPDGCTDPNAANYDANAVCDDGSCVACVYGCTGFYDSNYDPLATCDDGSCIPFTYGCMDPTAVNYNPSVSSDDGSCEYAGCMDDGLQNQTWWTDPASNSTGIAYDVITGIVTYPGTQANNYDSTATIDDGSCAYNVFGCTDPTACNYDSLANVDDGSCILPDGCMDATANNYDATAVCDDGSCTYSYGCIDPDAENYDPLATIMQVGSCTYCSGPYGCMDPDDMNYDSNAVCPSIVNNQFGISDVGVACGGVPGCLDCAANNLGASSSGTWPTYQSYGNGMCNYSGCNDPLALNYAGYAYSEDPIDDGSCLYAADCNGDNWINNYAFATANSYPGAMDGTVSACFETQYLTTPPATQFYTATIVHAYNYTTNPPPVFPENHAQPTDCTVPANMTVTDYADWTPSLLDGGISNNCVTWSGLGPGLYHVEVLDTGSFQSTNPACPIVTKVVVTVN